MTRSALLPIAAFGLLAAGLVARLLAPDAAPVPEDVQATAADAPASWAGVSPAFQGRFEEHEDVPAGPLTRLGAAIYEVDWADITDVPLEARFPFEVTTRDRGG